MKRNIRGNLKEVFISGLCATGLTFSFLLPGLENNIKKVDSDNAKNLEEIVIGSESKDDIFLNVEKSFLFEKQVRDYLNDIGVEIEGQADYNYKKDFSCENPTLNEEPFIKGKDCKGVCVGGLTKGTIYVISRINNMLRTLHPDYKMVISGASETFDLEGCPVLHDRGDQGNVFYLKKNEFSDEFYRNYITDSVSVPGFAIETFNEFYGFSKNCISNLKDVGDFYRVEIDKNKIDALFGFYERLLNIIKEAQNIEYKI